MRHVRNVALFACLCLASGAPLVAAENQAVDQLPEGHALADGKLTKEEIKKYAVLAAKHVKVLTATAREEVGEDLKQSGVVIPSAWMLMNDGEIKEVRLGQAGEQATATMKVMMFKAALKSLARHGKILGTAILYAGNVEGDPESRLMAIEYEHRLGVSGIQVVPYTFDHGDLTLGEPTAQKKPYELFYEGNQQKNGSTNNKT